MNRGRALSHSGKYDSAVKAFLQADAARPSNLRASSLIETSESLATAYAEAGNFSEAARRYRETLALVEKLEGRLSVNYAMVLGNLALLPTETGGGQDEVVLLKKTLDRQQQAGAAKNAILVRLSLGRLLMRQKRLQETDQVLSDLRSDLTKQQNADPRVLTQALIGLASLRFNGQRYEEAITFYLESIAVQEAATGLDDPALIRPLNNVATSYLKLGRPDYAYPVYRRAVRLCKQTLGEDHQVYGILLQNYSFVLRQLGRKREAKKLAAQSREIARACSLRDGINSTISVNALMQGTK